MSHNRFFRVKQQVWKGRDVISAWVWHRNKDGSERPSRSSGIVLTRPLWIDIFTPLEETIKSFGVDLEELAENLGEAALLSVQAKFSPFL
jgi:hypothetical protein